MFHSVPPVPRAKMERLGVASHRVASVCVNLYVYLPVGCVGVNKREDLYKRVINPLKTKEGVVWMPSFVFNF